MIRFPELLKDQSLLRDFCLQSIRIQIKRSRFEKRYLLTILKEIQLIHDIAEAYVSKLEEEILEMKI